MYKIVGKIIALSVVYEGPGPTFLFADSIMNYIFKDGNPIITKVEDIPDESIRESSKKVRLLILVLTGLI